MQDSVKINYNGEDFEIKKVPMRRYPALGMTLLNLPDAIVDMFLGKDIDFKSIATEKEDENAEETKVVEQSSLEQIIRIIPQLVIEGSETLPPFLAVASGVDLEKVLDGGLDDFLVLAKAVLEVNNIDFIITQVKNFIPTQQ